jgi:hypothetical protein
MLQDHENYMQKEKKTLKENYVTKQMFSISDAMHLEYLEKR